MTVTVNTNNKATREVLIWVALLLISMVAGLVINVVLEIVNRPLSTPGGELSSGGDVNFRQMLLALWYEHLIWFLGIFAVLGIVRMFFLFASSRTR